MISVNDIQAKNIRAIEKKHRILLRANEFISLLPHPNLRKYISSYNITFPAKDLLPNGFTVMPCGCATLGIENNGRNLFVNLNGPVTKPYFVGCEFNRLLMSAAVEFKPAGLYALTGINQSELTDKEIPLEAVSPAFSRSISQAVEKAANVCELAASLDVLLQANMYTDCHPQLRTVFKNILDCAGSIPVKELSHDMHCSERQMNRIFTQQVGTSAKAFSRLVRINQAFRLLKRPHNSLTMVSDLTGFHDLPHFIHDFKLVCGITPQKYRENMSGFYNNYTKY